MVSRRKFVIGGGVALAAEAVLAARASTAEAQSGHAGHAMPEAKRPETPRADGDYTPVTVPNGVTLPWKKVGGAKVFHLIAEEVDHEMVPGLQLACWGYNGRTPGPVIEVVEGDAVRIYVTNRLPEPTTVHWHGVQLPNGMDGVAGLTQPAIKVGDTFKYELVFKKPGTFMYHPHFDEMTQMALGMMGMIVVHPRRRIGPRIDRDFVLISSEWFIEAGTSRPNSRAMSDFNMLTFNSVAFPKTEPLVAKLGDRVRIRIGNLSAMDHHPIHLHGPSFKVVATDGGPISGEGQWPETTVLVPVGSTRDVELVCDAPGDWALHCHMTHHVMNQMGHEGPDLIGADLSKLDEKASRLLPSYMTMGTEGMGAHAQHMEMMRVPRNSVPMKGGPGPFGLIDMGGMFTILKVRPGIRDYRDPGWYEHPRGEVAAVATADDLSRDGVDTTPRQPSRPAAPKKAAPTGHEGHG